MKNTLLAAVVVALGLGTTVPYIVWAQDQPAAQGEHMRRGGRGFRGPGGRMGGAFGVMRDLTDAQREQVKAIRDGHAERIRPLAERVRAAREAIDTAVMTGNVGNLQALSIEVGNAETELTFAQAQVQAEIFSLLTAEQKQKIAERQKQMETRRSEMMKRRQNRQ